MDNILYKMMVKNAKIQLDSQNPEKPKKDDFNIFNISEVLAMLVGKLKEDVIQDIINA